MSRIKAPDGLQSITNHPDFCIYGIICCYDGNKKKVRFSSMYVLYVIEIWHLRQISRIAGLPVRPSQRTD